MCDYMLTQRCDQQVGWKSGSWKERDWKTGNKRQTCMAHFMCQCDGAAGYPDIGSNVISESACEGVSERSLSALAA